MISSPNDPSGRAAYTSDSRDCVDIFYDGPGDSTVRPSTGESLNAAKAERDKILYWEAVQRGEIIPDEDPAKWKLP